MVRVNLWIVLVVLFSLDLLTSAKSYSPYIIGGETAKVGAWPWMASIRLGYTHYCGGALIKPSVVLTTATCALRLTPLNSDVVLGLHDQEDGGIGKPVVIKIDSVIIHEDWTVERRYGNIAILKLAVPASNNSFVKPIALPEEDYDLTDKVCTVTGWGVPGKRVVSELQQKDLLGLSDVVCRRWWQNQERRLFCATSADGAQPAGVCRLDNGGPLSCPKDGGYVLGGLSVNMEAACTGDAPAIFTDIPRFIDWINENSV